jgi:hypothetical protein
MRDLNQQIVYVPVEKLLYISIVSQIMHFVNIA